MNAHKEIILLAHGSSDPNWLDAMEQLTAEARALPAPVSVAYMELAEPTLQFVVASAIERGARHIHIIPLFLAAGKHLREDIPGMIAALPHPDHVTITLADAVGEHPLLAYAITGIVRENL